jgi:regulator of RNase E activity RraA
MKGEKRMGKDPLVARLAKLDACAVSDALDRVGLKGVALGVRPTWPCPRIAGRAVTVKLKPAGLEKPKQHVGVDAIEAASPGDVIVVDHSGREEVSGWGGILATAAKLKGVSGVVIDGACRDIDEYREMGFPVYARAGVPLTARGRVVQHSFNQEIEFAGVSVKPGDLVIADGSGVVFIPSLRAEEVLAEAEMVAAREAEMVKDILAGRSVVEVMGLNYETMLLKK